MTITYIRKFTQKVAVLDDFDIVVLSDAIRMVLNTTGADDFPMLAEIEEGIRGVMATLKERLEVTPDTLQVYKPNYTPPATLQNEEELAHAIWALEKVTNNEPQTSIDEVKSKALQALYDRLTYNVLLKHAKTKATALF